MLEHYYELHISPSSYYEQFLDLVLSLTSEGLEESNGKIIIRSETDLSLIEDGVIHFASALAVPCDTQLHYLKNRDWIDTYQRSVEPVCVENFFIHPSWVIPREDKLNIQIDPALCFGSGHHETTASCLKALNRYVRRGDCLLDVGTGSGILAIAGSKLGATVDLCDTDELSLTSAQENFLNNGVVFDQAWVGSASLAQKEYDIIVANIVADVLMIIAKDLKKALKKGSLLILSGILLKHKSTIMDLYGDYELVDSIIENEWITLIVRSKSE